MATERQGAISPPTAAAAEAIRVEKLTKVYAGGVTAVDHLDLSVAHGEIFGLLGPNGAGKTTTVGMLTTRVVPTSGRVTVGGVDVVADPAGAKEVLGVVSQRNTLDGGLTARENLSFHARYFGMGRRAARAAADEWLERFRLAHRADAEVHTLSGGMARRLLVARAALHRPTVLFLDEPTAGLDPQSRLALWDVVAELHAGGQTIFLTTHYMEEADRFCQRLAVMDHGKVLALDSPADLKRSLGAEAWVTVRGGGDPRWLARCMASIPGATGTHVDAGAVRLQLERPDHALAQVMVAADRGGFTLSEVSVSEPSLEAVFLELTGRELRE